MKKNIFFIGILLFVLASCNEEIFEIDQKGVMSTSTTYANADDKTAEAMIASVYNAYKGPGFASVDMFLRINLNTLSDDGWSGATFSDNAATEQMFNKYQMTSDNPRYQTMWSNFYMTIYWSNMIVENMPGNTGVKQRVIAEAKAVRAICMMYMVRLWGNPPLVDHVLSEDELSMPNTPASESWVWIESQLNEAASGLPSKSGPDGQVAIGGRLTKEAAYAYLGKAQLLQGKYPEAANTLKTKVIDTDLYGLIDNFNDLNFYTSDFCKEYLWEYNIANDQATNNVQGDMRGVWYGYRSEYVVIPDEMIPETGWGYGAVSGDFGKFMEKHELLSDGTTLSPRFHGSLASYEELLDETTWHYNTYGRKGVYNPPLQNNEGYFRLKNMPYAVNKIPGQASPFAFRYHNNVVYMRYAEVLLLYAEATIQQGSQAGLDALNEVRTRAGLETLTSYTLSDLKEEKRAELFFEGERFLDLVRWGDAATVLDHKGEYIYAFYGYVDRTVNIQSKAQWDIDSVATGSEGFVAGKHELFPYPQIEVQSNLNLVQNLGGW